MAAKLYIGTSGWHYKHWKGTFYPAELKAKEHFDYYSRHFDTVEINNTFYRLPPKEVFTSWKEKVDKSFIYVVKASRFITHMKKLNDTLEGLTRFLENTALLGENLGPILFQLPPGWEINAGRLENFLKILPNHFRYVFEFRNATWYREEIYTLLEQYNCAFCIYELAGHLSPVMVTADFAYLRLHGPGGKYQGSYTDDALHKWAVQCREWLNAGIDTYVYFDNDEMGYAAFNALKLKELLGS
ncbi:DUF72 domain-containing protein [Flavobacterium album]|uniref:DUF72 domain-containing protein n=1 Tax=Flavobacterium album TaxID=2175091 RepID=A0A2S1R1T0_9FLAO|nr:DUF72 domain-containing protein [Flavobacterium album]AWH86594.1 DUF72 domain-containing protein [Flavobacterium album]